MIIVMHDNIEHISIVKKSIQETTRKRKTGDRVLFACEWIYENAVKSSVIFFFFFLINFLLRGEGVPPIQPSQRWAPTGLNIKSQTVATTIRQIPMELTLSPPMPMALITRQMELQMEMYPCNSTGIFIVLK